MTPRITAGAVIYAADLDRLAAFYEHALQFRRLTHASDHIVLTASSFQLVLLKRDSSPHKPEAAPITPRSRRSDAAIKPVFVVASIADVRAAAPPLGGLVNASAHEWRFGDFRVCDALDPDGNVLQLRERVPVVHPPTSS